MCSSCIDRNAKYVFFFFLSSHHDTMLRTLYFICIIFVKNIIIYWLILTVNHQGSYFPGGGRVVRWCWENFQCRGVLLLRKIVGQGPTVLVVGAGGGCLDIFSLVYHFSFLSPSLWETARYRLKYCLKGPLSPKQPTNQHHIFLLLFFFFGLRPVGQTFLYPNKFCNHLKYSAK